jgi:hypothetical protein
MEITWKFEQPPLMNFESFSHKLVSSKHVLQNILPFPSVTHGNDFVQLWQKNFVIASIVHTVVLLPRFVFHVLLVLQIVSLVFQEPKLLSHILAYYD